MTQIKEDENYWIIGSNKWSKNNYSKEESIKYSDTLINCSNCLDCSNCSSCHDCRYCRYCRDCRYCFDCSSCRDCHDCSYCSNCNNCRYCSNCHNCSSCSSCREFKTNPQRITSPILGSRDSQTTYYWNEQIEQIVCGCFCGTLEEFENQIKVTHGENDFAKGYFDWINAVKNYKQTYGGNK